MNSSAGKTHAVIVDDHRRSLMERIGDFWALGVLVLIIAIFTAIEPAFMSVPYWLSTLVYMSEILLLSLGQTYVIITAGIDLSVGANEGFVGIVAALVMKHLAASMGAIPAVLFGVVAGLLVGILIGAVNGFIVTRMRITPFVATLGMMGVLTGLTFIFSGGNNVTRLPLITSRIGNSVFCGVLGFPVIVSILVTIFLMINLSQSQFGLRTYAIGSNCEAAKRAGVNVDRHLIKVYMLAGFLASLSGILILMRFATASPLTGSTIQLNSVAAAAIGGVSLLGGKGNIFGTVVGSAIISVLITGLVMINVDPYWQLVAIGAIIIAAVYIDQIRSQK